MNKITILILLLGFFCLELSSAPTCNYKYTGFVTNQEHHHEHDAVLDWGQCAESELCSVGREQSPIDIDTTRAVIRPDLGRLQFEPGKLKDVSMTWTGHNQVFSSTSHPENEASSFLHKELNEPYHLIQYHLHTPSEHTLDGVYFDAEVHLVHMNEARNTLAVIGIFVQQSNHSQDSEFFETMIHEENHEHEHDETKFQDFDPTVFSKELDSAEYFHYKGSLTTPPCSERVNWFVMRSVLSASPEQLQRLKRYQRHNSRPIQPVYERTVSFYPEEHLGNFASPINTSPTNFTNQKAQFISSDVSVLNAELLVNLNEKQEL